MSRCFCNGGGDNTEWGTILGNIANQTDLINYIEEKTKNKKDKYLDEQNITVWDNVVWYNFVDGLDATVYYNGAYKESATKTVGAYEISRVQKEDGSGKIDFLVSTSTNLFVCKGTVETDGATFTTSWTQTTLLDMYEVKSNKTNTISSTSTDNQYPTAKAVYTALNSSKAKLLSYPVGSIMYRYDDKSPASLLGGSWTRLNQCFLFAGGTGEIGKTGGEFTHTLSVGEMPSHGHNGEVATTKTYGKASLGLEEQTYYKGAVMVHGGGDYTFVGATGGSGAHNNMPPYIQVAVWRRTA